MRRAGTRVAAGIAFLACAASAAETIPLLLPGETVEATLSASGEEKSVGFAGVEGSKLLLTAKAVKGSRVRPELTLVEPDGADVDLGETNPKSGATAKTKSIVLGATGVWRVGVATPAGAGGDFALSAKAKVPLKFSWSGAQVDAASVADQFVPAAPGGTISISLKSKGRPGFDPSVELIAPSGASVLKVTGADGRAAMSLVPLDELGRYTVRVTGGPGAFSAKAVVKPGPKRTPAFRDVEALPDIRSVTPSDTTNDRVVRFEFAGVGFSTQQTVAIVDGAATQAAAAIGQAAAAGASADVDLAGVAAGTYDIRVSTPSGNFVTAQGGLTVTNRTPAVSAIVPVEASNFRAFGMELRGAGFDAASTLTIRRASDGLDIPLTITSRVSHTSILATVSPSLHVTGPCDVTVRDPDGGNVVVAGGLDLLGFRSAPAMLRQYSGVSAYTQFNPRDSAFDAVNGRVLVAIQEAGNAVFVLFDATTIAVLDQVVVTPATLGAAGGIMRPRVAWDGVTGTFAWGMTAGANDQANAFVRIVSATNIKSSVLQTKLAGPTKSVSEVSVAANGDDGGYVVVWEEFGGAATGSKIRTQVVAPALTVDTATQTTIASHALGYIWEPVIAYQGNHRFVAAWAGAASNDSDYAVYAAALDASGHLTPEGTYATATSPLWNNLFQPEITPNPGDGSMLLAFTYLDINMYRPGAQRLAPVTAAPGPYSSLDSDGQLPQGYIDSVRWNPARGEFVATMTNALDRVAVRRVNPDGSLRPSPVLESYEGVWGILWSGPQSGQFGLVRGFDGVDDDLHSTLTQKMQALAGPIR